MKHTLPAQEIRTILEGKGFLRLHGQDRFLYISDAPRRISADALLHIKQALREHGFITQVDSSGLLLIDLRPERWEALLMSFQHAAAVPIPENDELHGVYALARLLQRHPADFARQPMDMIRGLLKQYGRKNGLPALALRYSERCAERLRRGEPLPSSLANVLFSWLREN